MTAERAIEKSYDDFVRNVVSDVMESVEEEVTMVVRSRLDRLANAREPREKAIVDTSMRPGTL